VTDWMPAMEPELPSDCLDVLAFLYRAHAVRAFHYFIARPPPPIQESVPPDEARNKLISDALTLRADLGIPFIDAVMLTMLSSGPDSVLLEALGRHFAYLPSIRTVETDPLLPLRDIVSSAPPDSMAVVTSAVDLRDGITKHIPMLDFRFAATNKNEQLVTATLRALGVLPGYLLSSGNSFHYYGARLLSADQLRAFLARALIYGPVVDKAWASHQLIEGYCALRISPRAGIGYPKVIAILDE
jgi:hypothetical protein